ncbi:MAG TPA: HEAT repeat domain-containing protein [Gemmatimonadaceae bacterium]|nr:HEAT repeat domain-containing protein [Gemmatimonadaceae bacterium]
MTVIEQSLRVSARRAIRRTAHTAHTLSVALLALGAPAALRAQGPGQSTARPSTIPKSGSVPREPTVEQKLQASFKAPSGFNVTLFAGPPVAMYPTCVNESPDGAVFVCVDPNLSLSTLRGVGRVMRLVDTDHDGRADTYTTFAEMDSPRGVVADGKTVYVMHPPTLTAYRDTNGDGIADTSVDIVKGLGFDLDFRGADHTTNNIELGPDGWLYVAVGDYGFMKAVGTDGKTISHRGGAVVRVRPDGTNLEIVTVGTRNIYDVAIDPFARVYSRDNTNDGDGWDTRLHYLAPGANMGYPSLYQNFASEHFPTLHDYGPGSGVGGLWLQDPAWPAGFNNTLYTGDWTTQRIYKHSLTPKGSIFDITQDEFISLLRPSDLAIDGSSNLYVASLAGGQFTYNSDTVGYVVQVRPSTATPARETPVLGATDTQLLVALGSPNMIHRLHASVELVRRGGRPATITRLRQAIADTKRSADTRAAAIFTLKQLQGARANDALVKAASDADARVRETALRALADRTDQLQGATPALYVKALGDADPQVQVQAIRGLVRLGARDAAGAILPLTGSADQGISHLAVNALVSLGASSTALKGIDGTPAVRAGALRALAQMYDAATVTALTDRLSKASDAPTRAALVHTLARLANREGPWKGDWWTTKPAHLGPYFDPAGWEESPRIRTALASTLKSVSGDEFVALANDLALNEALPRGAQPLLAAVPAGDPLRAQLLDALVGRAQLDAQTVAIATTLDARSPALHAAVAQLLAGESALGGSSLPLARTAVLDPKLDPTLRGSLLQAISQAPGESSLDVAAEVFARLNPVPGMPAVATPAAAAAASPTQAGNAAAAGGADPVETAWRRFVGDRRRMNELDYFIKMATSAQPSQRTLAYAVLLQSIRTPRTPAPVRAKVAPVVEAAWADPASAPSLVQAISLMRLEGQYTDKLAAYNQNNPSKSKGN